MHAALASIADLCVVLFDAELRVVELHGAALEAHGYTAERVVGRCAADLLSAATWELLEPLAARALAGETVTLTLTLPVRARTVYDLTFGPTHGPDGLVVGGTLVARDVTAHSRAQDALKLFETSFEKAPVGVCLTALDGRFLRVNVALCRLLERDEAELLDSGFGAVTHPDDIDASVAALQAMLAGVTERCDFDKRYLTGSGGVVETRVNASLVRDAAGRPVHFVTHIVDVGALQAARRELGEVNGRLQAILDHTPMAIYMRDLEDRWTLANPETCRVLGRTGSELIGRSLRETHPALHEVFAANDDLVLESGGPASFEEVVPDPETGAETHFWSLRFPVRDPEGAVVGVGGVSLDVTERERVSRELVAANELFETAFATAPVGMLISREMPGGGTEVVQCNAAFAGMSGLRPEELLGGSATGMIHPDDLPERARLISELAAGSSPSGELRFRHRDGHDVAALVAPSLTHGPDGERLIVIQALDISERKRFERRLRHLADHDPLTGLLNRRRFEEELAREVSRVQRTGRAAALVMLDLDGFKDVNDAFGHSAGDQLIARVGAAIGRSLRPTDVLARIGGDEFAVILPATDQAGAGRVAEKLVEVVRGHGRLFTGDRHAEVTASVGLTTLAVNQQEDGEALLVEADIAMYQAKDAGKDRVAVYERAERRREHLTRQSDWIGRLRRAIKEEHFVLHAQPILPLLKGGAPPGREHFELLLRLRGDDGQLVPPGTFLPHAERHGLVGDIDRWVLGQAVTTLHAAHTAGRDLHLAVNLSARTMQDPEIAAHLATLLAVRPITPRALLIEVTETAAITNVARAGELARQLRDLGCLLALDDFGAGFASFYYLKHLVFDVLKIDGDFIDRLPHSTTDQLVVRAVVDIARGLGAQVIAERVQDDETVALLRELGVDFGQGFHLGRPGPLPA